MNAKELDDRIKSDLLKTVAAAKSVLDRYEASPECCRMVSDGHIRRVIGQATPKQLGMVETARDVWKCPVCNRCVLDQS